MKVTARAPVRIDLAGGTLDIWPLYLLLKQAATTNLAIDLFATTEIETSPGGGIVTFQSEDQSIEKSFKIRELQGDTTPQVPPSLEIHCRIFRHLLRFTKKDLSNEKIRVKTQAQSPAGAGLGGSSALTISAIGATSSFLGLDWHQNSKAIELARDIETQILRVPAGLQDYYAAFSGGLRTIDWRPVYPEQKTYSTSTAKEIERRLILFYSGQSRNSGINNWQLTKRVIDQDQETIQKFEQIAEATGRLTHALEKENWADASEAIESEWRVRKTLAEEITTPEIEAAFREAKNQGIPTGKICGAGGGGCFFFFVKNPDEELKERLVSSVVSSSDGLRHLPFSASSAGLQVE